MPLARRAVRPGPVREPGSAARAEPVRSPRNQADAAPATSACSASVRRSSSDSPPSASISSAHDHRVRGERVVVAHPPAPAAAVGEHVGQRLEVDIGGRDGLRIVRPGERPVRGRGALGPRFHALSPVSVGSSGPPPPEGASPARRASSPGGSVRGPGSVPREGSVPGDPVDGLDGAEALRLEVLDGGERRAARREERDRPGVEHEPRHPPAVGAVQHQLGVAPVGGGEALERPLHAGVAVDALLLLEQLDGFVLLREEDHPVGVLPGRAGGGVGVVVVDALRAGDQRAAVLAGAARGAFEEGLAVLAREQVPGLVDDDRLRPCAGAVIHALGGEEDHQHQHHALDVAPALELGELEHGERVLQVRHPGPGEEPAERAARAPGTQCRRHVLRPAVVAGFEVRAHGAEIGGVALARPRRPRRRRR